MKVLVTGFEPFGGDSINASLEIIRNLPRRWGGGRIATASLPVVYGAASRILRRMVALERPRAVLALGLAGGRTALSFEIRAVNLDDTRIPDNDGNQPHLAPALPGAPTALTSTLPLESIFVRLRRAGIPVEASGSAGTFLCNHVFYHLMHHTWLEDPSLLAGFVHVPFIEEQRVAHPEAARLPLETLVRGILATLTVLEQ